MYEITREIKGLKLSNSNGFDLFLVLIFYIFKKTIEFTLTLAWKPGESKPLRYYESDNSYV